MSLLGRRLEVLFTSFRDDGFTGRSTGTTALVLAQIPVEEIYYSIERDSISAHPRHLISPRKSCKGRPVGRIVFVVSIFYYSCRYLIDVAHLDHKEEEDRRKQRK